MQGSEFTASEYLQSRLQELGVEHLFGGGLGLDARTEGALEAAIGKAADEDGLELIEIHTARMDCPEALVSAGKSMAKANQLD